MKGADHRMPEEPTGQTPQKVRSARAAGSGGSILRRLGFWSLGLVLAFAILVSLAGLAVVMMPASLLLRNLNSPVVGAIYGSLRDGRADLQGGYRLEWQSALGWGYIGTPFTLSGPDTRVTGMARIGLTAVQLNTVEGRAGPGLAQMVPGAWNCDMTARLADVGFAWGWRSAGADGQVTTPGGTCTKGDRETAIPPLTLDLQSDGADAMAILRAQDAPPMAIAHIRRNRVLDLRIEPAAAEVFPALPRGGPITLQLPF